MKLFKAKKKAAIAEFDDLFFIETARFDFDDKKDALPFIMSEASRLLKDATGEENGNFYYAYTLKKTDKDYILNFLVVRSTEYMEGKLPVVAKAFFTPGQYVYRSGRRHFVIFHQEDGTMSTDIRYERQDGFIDLTDFDQEAADAELPAEIPSTLYMKWSLSGKHFDVNIILAVMMFMAVVNLFYQGSAYERVAAEKAAMTKKAALTQKEPVIVNNLAVLPGLIKEVGSKLDQKGHIASIKGEGTKLSIAIKFDNELQAREFIQKNGGIYEDGKVVLGYGAAGSSNPNPGH